MRPTVALAFLAPHLIDAAVPAVQCRAVSKVISSLKVCKTATSFCSSLLGIKTSTVIVQAATPTTATSGSSTVADTTVTSSVTFTAAATTQVTRTDTVSIGPDCTAKSTVTGRVAGSNAVPRAEHQERDALPQARNPLLAIARGALSTACHCLSLTTPTTKVTKTSTVTVEALITPTTTQTVATVYTTSTSIVPSETTLPAPAQCTANIRDFDAFGRKASEYLCVGDASSTYGQVNLDSNPGSCLWRRDSTKPDLDILGGNRATFLRFELRDGKITDTATQAEAYVADHVQGGKLQLDLAPTKTTDPGKTPVQCAFQAGISMPVKAMCYNSNGEKYKWYSVGEDSVADELFLGLDVPEGGHERAVMFRPTCAHSDLGFCIEDNPDPLN